MAACWGKEVTLLKKNHWLMEVDTDFLDLIDE